MMLDDKTLCDVLEQLTQAIKAIEDLNIEVPRSLEQAVSVLALHIRYPKIENCFSGE
jgi:hypothetical protein